MIDKATDTDLGRRVAALRVQRGFSQGAVSRRAGIHPSYLSRIETGKVHPTVRTATRIAGAMRISLNDLLGPTPAEKDHPCPVTVNGQCLVDLMDTHKEPGGMGEPERYSPRQIRLLRRFMSLLRQSPPSVLTAVEVLVNQLLDARKEKAEV
jgi:DNA-binding XRE family transcriptional regulator